MQQAIRNFNFIGLLVITLLQACTSEQPKVGEWYSLFNGKSLEGWIPKIKGYQTGENFANTFRIEEGFLTVSYDGYESFDQKYGHLFFEKPFTNYKLKTVYRFLEDQATNGEDWAFKNSGVMIHGQSPSSMLKDQDFPISIEVQLLGGKGDGKSRSTCNLCTPGTHVWLNNKLEETHCINSSSSTFHGQEWVTAEIEVWGDSVIRHFVNGQAVMEYSKPVIGGEVVNGFDPKMKPDGQALGSGYISLQSESHPIQFKSVEIMLLK